MINIISDIHNYFINFKLYVHHIYIATSNISEHNFSEASSYISFLSNLNYIYIMYIIYIAKSNISEYFSERQGYIRKYDQQEAIVSKFLFA